ncbi:helix-turn-helix transcriptional regulator [Pseudomonadota bacterium]|jgi:predicted DNA-binding transcriptional regulator AlpA
MKLLTKKQLKEKVGYSFSHIDRLEKANRFPQRVKPFGRNGRAFWVDEEVDDWIANLILERGS